MNEDMMTKAERTLIAADGTDGSLGKCGKGVFHIYTFGCQMNMYDSERATGIPEVNSYVPATEDQINDNDFDLLVFNTCAAHENTVEHMYGTVGRFNRVKLVQPNLQIAAGGCMAQLNRKKIAGTASWVSAVFGTGNIEDLPRLLDQNRATDKAQVQVIRQLRQFPTQLPAARASRIGSQVTTSVDCDSTCMFCIVSTTRGRKEDHRPGDILDEIRQCVVDGAEEVTLLGQNVSSFGYGVGDRYTFSKLLRVCSAIDDLERACFTSPRPAALTDNVTAAMVETPNIMHQLHFPLQPGFDHILHAMCRSYRSAKSPGILGRTRAAMPGVQISINIIAGFPGETEEDSRQIMDVMRQARFPPASTFIHSLRPDTSAAVIEQILHNAAQGRFNRLVALQKQITEESLAAFGGRDIEMTITSKLGKKDTNTHRATGREKTGVSVHIGAPEGKPVPEIGDFVTAAVTYAGRHNLLVDPDMATGQTYSVRY